ncbi:hypothetical protein RRG08_017949 [Elysia crispata]|uniref:Lipase domain-containing protein n=1 Tax=Elysia crispata TaxID=231223 RepID=A0AAE0ZCU2_9GAST|nr:hypothetical protein RRG08_017949 [Elysia crispata]
MAIELTLTVILNLAAMTAVSLVSGKEVCYPVVGCFNNDAPFNNADQALPSNPLELGTKFHLYTWEKTEVPTSLVYTQPVSIKKSNFRSDRPTKVIIHGLNNSERSQWIINMRRAFLKQGDYNVIVVHWHKGARLTSYPKASANVRLVATQIKVLLKLLQRTAGLQLEDVHLIGHSLGAHISGYAGTLLGDKIGRITGLDPADPNFQHLPFVIRLDPADAQFVDVIHTDGRNFANTVGFGLAQQSGHIDFYVNGGENQKGCEDGIKGLIGGILKAVRGQTDTSVLSSAGKGAACSHARAHEIFTESINSICRFKSFPCQNYGTFLRGECYACSLSGCSEAGFHADDHPTAKGKHYLMTYAKGPFCGAAYYNLMIEMKPGQGRSEGNIYIQLRNKSGSRSRKISLMDRNTAKLGHKDITMPIVLDKSLQELGRDDLLIELTYKKRPGVFDFWGLTTKALYIEAVKLTEVATGQSLASRKQLRSLSNDVANVITLKRQIPEGSISG